MSSLPPRRPQPGRPAGPPRRTQPGQTRPPAKSSSNLPLVLGAICGGLVLLIAVGIGAVWLLKSRAPAAAQAGDPAGGASSPTGGSSASAAPTNLGFTTQPGQTAAESAVPWTATADPPAAAVRWPDAPQKTALTMASYSDELLYPSTPSSFGIAGVNGESPQFFDLAAGGPPKPAGKTRIGRSSGSSALSPDGKFVVHTITEKGPGGGYLVELLDVATGGSLGKIEPISIEGSSIGIVEFGPENNPLVVYFGKESGLKLFNRTDGKLLREIKPSYVPLSGQQNSFALSPGRRYAAIWDPNKHELSVYDLKTGQTAGRVSTPKQGRRGDPLRLDGLAWSPDGARLALTLDGLSESLVLLLDATTGKTAKEYPLAAPIRRLTPSPGYDGLPIEWTADGKFLLLDGSSLLDLESGRMPWRLAVLPVPSSIGVPLYPSDWRRVTPWGAAVMRNVDERTSEMQVLTFPEPADLAAADALLAPGQPLAIDVQPGPAVKDPQAAVKLRDVLTRRVEAEGMTVAADAPLTLRLAYDEPEGSKYTQGPSIGFPGLPGQRPPSQPAATVTGVRPTARLTLADKSGKELWAFPIVCEPISLSTSGNNFTPEAVREAAYKEFVEVLSAAPVPYHVSKDGAAVLPATEVLGGPAGKG